DLVALGDAYRDAGRFTEAVQFYNRAQAEDSLAELKDLVIDRGDSALLLTIQRVLKNGVKAADWKRLAEAALRKEKYSAAAEAFEKAGEEEAAAEAKEKLAELLQTVKQPEPIADPDDPDDPSPGYAGHQTKMGG
ncbi:MAG: hypothetical protein O6952_10175, partial [Planctomycetota bacterium]|nr:hypothetical protein [Planctomycetota bacterium]